MGRHRRILSTSSAVIHSRKRDDRRRHDRDRDAVAAGGTPGSARVPRDDGAAPTAAVRLLPPAHRQCLGRRGSRAGGPGEGIRASGRGAQPRPQPAWLADPGGDQRVHRRSPPRPTGPRSRGRSGRSGRRRPGRGVRRAGRAVHAAAASGASSGRAEGRLRLPPGRDRIDGRLVGRSREVGAPPRAHDAGGRRPRGAGHAQTDPDPAVLKAAAEAFTAYDVDALLPSSPTTQ